MIAAIWLPSYILNYKNKSFSKHLMGFIIPCIILLLTMWLVGYFTILSEASAVEGYGLNKLNLLSIFDAGNFSYVLKDIPEIKGDYEGFNYLGLGVLLLSIYVIPVIFIKRTFILKCLTIHKWLILNLIILTIFSISNRISIAGCEITIPIPNKLIELFSVFRASGRFFWPVSYSILLGLFYISSKIYTKRILINGLLILFVVQCVDTSKAWFEIRSHFMEPKREYFDSPLRDPFWNEITNKIDFINVVSPFSPAINWKNISYYAVRNKKGIDQVYLARVPSSMAKIRWNKFNEMIGSNTVDNKTLYFCDDVVVRQIAVLAQEINAHFIKLDGFNVLYANDLKEPQESKTILPSDYYQFVKKDDEYLTNINGKGKNLLFKGWTIPDLYGAWSIGKSSTIIFKNNGNIKHVKINLSPLINNYKKYQELIISINNKKNRYKIKESLWIDLDVPDEQIIKITFDYLDIKSPKSLKINDSDDRPLSVCIHNMIFS